MDISKYTAAPQSTALAKSNLAQQVIDDTRPDFLPTIRIVQPASSDSENPAGSWSFMGQENLGLEVPVVIYPWRFHAVRFKNDSIDAEDFNMWENSVYNAVENDWEHPGYTPGYLEIKEKHVPDDYQGGISNCAGFDMAFYLPSHQTVALYLLAKTALSMTNVYDVCKSYRGRRAILTSELKENKRGNRWYVPKIILEDGDADAPVNPELIAKQLESFLNPGKVYIPE